MGKLKIIHACCSLNKVTKSKLIKNKAVADPILIPTIPHNNVHLMKLLTVVIYG